MRVLVALVVLTMGLSLRFTGNLHWIADTIWIVAVSVWVFFCMSPDTTTHSAKEEGS